MNYLNTIIDNHRLRATQDDRSISRLLAKTEAMPPCPEFINSLEKTNQAGKLGVIAEIKRGSPSKGRFTLESFDNPTEWASRYTDAGASCISVLTDQTNFFAKPNDLIHASSVGTPCLRKDFTVSVKDVIDARLMGASAVLLIAAALDANELTEFSKAASDVGLDCLYEIHSIEELDKLANCEPKLIGVNQRDLETFEVDTERAMAICDSIDNDFIKVAESGIETVTQAEQIAKGGFNAVLIGESIATAPDPDVTLAGFAGIKL